MKKAFIFTAALVLLLGIYLVASRFYGEGQKEAKSFLAQENAAVFVRSHAQSLGSDEAKVILIEFFDPACETCASFSPYIKKLIESSNGRIKLVLRYAPFHQGSELVVRILEAAGRQGKYWQTLDLLFQTQSVWASHHNPQPQKIWQYLPRIGLDLDRLKKDIDDPYITKIVKQDIEDARTLDVTKTPGFFVNGKPLLSFGWNQLMSLLGSELQIHYPDDVKGK